MIPASALADTETFTYWVDQEIRASASQYAGAFFGEKLEATSLLSTLEEIAERRGIEPQQLVQEEMDKLIKYCHPFWQYDQNRGLHDMEGKSIIGVEDEHNPLIPDEYRTGSLYEIKATGFRDRIDVVRLWHGLPAFMIQGMEEYRNVYERKRKGLDPLHILPGMELVPDLMPEKDQRSREMFAIGQIFGYIVQLGAWYYFDPERGYLEHQIQPSKERRLAQGREKAEEAMAHKEDWANQIDQMVDAEVRQMGNEWAIQKMDEAISAHQEILARMGSDDPLRKQFEKEIGAFKNMQRRLGKIG